MALFIETSDSSGNLQRKALVAGRNRVNAEPGARFRLIDDRGLPLDSSVGVKRVNQKLVIDGLPDDSVLEVDNFFRNCTADYPCAFSLENFRGATVAEITPLSLPVGALQDGSFVMHAPDKLVQAVPVEPESETAGRGWIYAGAGVLGLAAAGGSGGKSGGTENTAVGSSSPATPTLTSPKTVASATPILSGTGTPGSTITVTLDLGNNGTTDLSYTTIVAADGRWNVVIGQDTPSVSVLPNNRLPEGPTQLLVRASNAGGTSVGLLNETLIVDTIAPAAPVINAVTGDNTVSASEAAANIVVTGRAEPGARLSVNWLGVTRSLSADANGDWSATYTPGEIRAAGSQRTVQVTATDAAGNSSLIASQVVALPSAAPTSPVISTVAGNDIVNRSEATAGVVVSGTSDPGARVTVSFGTVSRAASVSSTGGSGATFSATFANTDLPADGTVLVRATVVNADGSAGGETSRSVLLDRVVPNVSLAAVTGDNIISFPERSAGVTVTGSAETGSSLVVSWGTASRTVSATNGTFGATFDPASIPGSGVSSVTATATDPAGNSNTTSLNVVVNTIATNYLGTAGNNTLLLDRTELANLAAPGANINGAGGIDTFSFNGAGLSLNLLNIPATAITSFERVNLTGTGNNALTLSVVDVLDFASSNVFNLGTGWTGLSSSVAQRQLVVDGNSGDTLTASGGWTLQPVVVSNGGQAYVVYTSGTGSNAAMLIIDTDISRMIT